MRENRTGTVLLHLSVAVGLVLVSVSNEHFATTQWGFGDGDEVRNKKCEI